MKKIYVGNLPFSATEERIRDVFSQRGTVLGVSLVGDRATDRFRGYGYVDIDDAALENVLKLDGKSFDNRPMRVVEAVEKVGGEGGN